MSLDSERLYSTQAHTLKRNILRHPHDALAVEYDALKSFTLDRCSLRTAASRLDAWNNRHSAQFPRHHLRLRESAKVLRQRVCNKNERASKNSDGGRGEEGGGREKREETERRALTIGIHERSLPGLACERTLCPSLSTPRIPSLCSFPASLCPAGPPVSYFSRKGGGEEEGGHRDRDPVYSTDEKCSRWHVNRIPFESTWGGKCGAEDEARAL